MEEMVEAVDNARQIFERWMAWEPDDMAWAAFIKFEMRQGQIERARAVYERYVALLPTCRAYLKYAHWEEKNHQRGLTRRVYERSLVELHPHERTEKLLINFARFEERCKEYERARVVYQYALGQVENNDSVSGNKEEEVSELKKEFVAFEKRHGDKTSIDEVIITQRREKYEELLRVDRFDYDTWFDYIRLEEAEQDADRVRAVYTRAVASVPPVLEKRYWRRYVYLWINYALFEELTEKDISRTRAVYKACLDVIPHRAFTFGKMWLLAAQLEVRVKDLAAARRILGQGIGLCGKENIFKGYIELELQLGEVDRCRTLYSKYIEKMPFNCAAWKAFAQLETNCGEIARARCE
jgi:crooked neck